MFEGVDWNFVGQRPLLVPTYKYVRDRQQLTFEQLSVQKGDRDDDGDDDSKLLRCYVRIIQP